MVIIAALLVAYWRYSDYRAAEKTAYEHKMALATAQVWIASATFRNDPDQFLQARDSILAACSLTVYDVNSFVELNIDQPEKLQRYTTLMQEYVDSLLDLQDSLRVAAADSLK